jgi:hypothetical protein
MATGFRVTMPVTAAGPQQPELKRQVGEPWPQVGIMAGMTSLHCVQSFGFQPFEHGPGPMFLEMRHWDHPTGGVDHICHRPERGERLLDEGRFAPSDESVEGIARVSGSSMADDRASDMRPPHGTSRRLLENGFERHLDSQVMETANHFFGSADPIGPAAL